MKMSKDVIQQNDVIHRYVRGRLSREEIEEFEVYMLDNPAVLEAVELEQVLIASMARQPKADRTKTFVAYVRQSWKPFLGGALSTAVVMSLIVFLPIVSLWSPIDKNSVGGPTQLVYIDNLRSSNQSGRVINVDLLNNVSSLVLVVSPNFTEPAQYAVTLHKDTDVIVNYPVVDVTTSGDITVILPHSLGLKAGKYSLNVTPLNVSEAQSERIILVLN